MSSRTRSKRKWKSFVSKRPKRKNKRNLTRRRRLTELPTLRGSHAFQEPEVPLGNNPKDVFSDNSSLTNDDEFQPEPTSSSATERAASDKTDDESETELPPKKKAKTAKEPVQVQVSNNAGSGKSKGGKKNSEVSIAVSTLITTKGNQLADEKKLPHGDNVSDGNWPRKGTGRQ
jgi:hypothetical protein